MKNINSCKEQRWIVILVQQFILTASLFFLIGCETSDAPPSSELLEKIQKAVTSSNPEIYLNSKEIPAAVFGDGAKATIAMQEPIIVGSCVFITDLSNNLRFQGTMDKTIYKGGRGAVVMDGNKVYLYHLTVTEQELVAVKQASAIQ
jgi:hypothetical protein